MLKRLRLKFIALNMTIVAAALLVVFGAVCYLNYQAETSAVYLVMHETLERASNPEENVRGRTARLDSPTDRTDVGGETTGGDEAAGENDFGSFLPPEIGGRDDDRFIPVAVYYLDQSGVIAAASPFASAALTSEALAQAAALMQAEAYGEGFLDGLGLYYLKEPADNGCWVAFADESSASSWKTLAVVLAGVGLVALAGFLVISVFFSRWALRPVERAWEQQQRFVADASHELKTPLTVILANTAIVRAHPGESVGSQSQWIESTQTEAERMQGLVNDMLALAQMESENGGVAGGKASRKSTKAERDGLAPLDLSDLTEGEVLQFESVAFEAGLELQADVQPGIRVRGDAARLQRMVRTLVDNACKYAEPGGSIHVELKTEGAERARSPHAADTAHRTRAPRAANGRATGVPHATSAKAGRAVLVVRNTGSTIAAEDLPHVFDRFYRADKARTRNEGRGQAAGGERGGYGLGLAIAQEIAREHGGRIEATSSEAEGTAFAVTLPTC